MAQQKKTDGISTGLPNLTDKQMSFVQGVLSGMTASDAYRAAYSTENQPDHQIWRDASVLKSNPKVVQWLNAAKIEQLKTAQYGLEAHCAELDELVQLAKETGNLGAAVNATVNKGKAMGIYVERHEDVSKGDPVQTLEDIAAISQELAVGLAQQMGIDWPPKGKLN